MESMDEIYRAYAQTVYHYLLALTRDADLAEELTQETFYQAIRSVDRFRGESRVSTWLCAIAKNQLSVYRRRRAAEPVSEADTLALSAETEALDALERRELLRAIHALGEPGREVLYLRAFGALSYREIGDIFGKTENWARVTCCRAREKLRKEWRK